MNTKPKYPISYVASQTGLNQILIRTWENRYDFLNPERSSGNRRLYNEEELHKLMLIKKAIDKGFRIGQLAKMSNEEIHDLLGPNGKNESKYADTDDLIVDSIEYIRKFDNLNFKKLIDREMIRHSKRNFITAFVLPLLDRIGILWEKGEIKVSNEHFATEIIRGKLISMIEIPDNTNSPCIIAGTPKNQQHDLVSLALAVLVSIMGFKVLFIGASVPAEEIISVAEKTGALAVILSIIYPNDDISLLGELSKLKGIGENTDIYIGGASAYRYYEKLDDKKFNYINDIDKLLENLNKSRRL
mgnify:CR=1 FL=1